MTTTVVNIRFTRETYVYCGRSGKGVSGEFGNPFSDLPREQAIEAFRIYFHNRVKVDPEFRQAVEQLRGRNLGCFCKPLSCHADVIAEYLNKEQHVAD